MENEQFWIVMGLILAACEMVLPGFVIIFFGVGAIVTGILVWLLGPLSMMWQLAIFLVCSVGSLVVFRRGRCGTGWRQGADFGKNYDEEGYVGHRVKVVVAIPGGVEPGKVELDGTNWEAVAAESIPAGERVQIVSREGLLLKVERIKTDFENK